MSKLSEYLALIPKGVSNLKQVLEGVVNDVAMEFSLLGEEERDVIIKRRLTCLSCPYMSKNANTSPEYFSLMGEHYTTDREDSHCSFCGCPLSFRTASLDMDCGIEDYNEEHPDTPLPLKWTKYENGNTERKDS